MENYYSLLGVEPSSSKQEIRKAYLKLLKKYHPDVYNGDKKTAENVTIELNKAYTILSDIEKRRDYDSQLKTYKNYDIKQKPQKANEYKTFTHKRTSTENVNTYAKFKNDKQKAKDEFYKKEYDKKNEINKIKRKNKKNKSFLGETKLNFAIFTVVLAIVVLIFILILI